MCFQKNWSQQPVNIQLTEKDGLPDIEFYDILEDHNGFIWLAADKGLYRYDGNNYTYFTHPKKRGLSVFGLFEDKTGRVWCNTIMGQFFYVEKDNLVLFADLKDELNGKLPEFIVEDNNLKAFSEKGIFNIDLKTKKRNLIRDKSSASSYYGTPFSYNKKEYFVLHNEVKSIKNNIISKEITICDPKILPSRSTFCKIKEAILFSSTVNNKLLFFLKKGPNDFFKRIYAPKELIHQKIIKILYIDNKLWMCTENGVVVCHYKNGEITYQDTYLKQEFITNIIKDKNNNYWFTTLRNGVFVMPNIHIRKIELPENVKQINRLVNVNNNWLIYGSVNGKIGFFDNNLQNHSVFDLPNSSKISEMIYNENYKSLFINQESQSLIWQLPTRKLFKTSFHSVSKGMTLLPDNNILNASFDRADNIVNPFKGLSTNLSLQAINIPRFDSKIIEVKASSLMMKRSYTTHYSTKTKKSFIGFVDQLQEIDTKGNYRPILFNNDPIFAIDIQETSNGIIWVSTFKDGVLGIKNNTVFINYTTKNGLVSNQTQKLKADRNNLWIVTDNGLQVLDTKTGFFKTLTKSDGLETYNISDIEILNNQVYIASNMGIYILDKQLCFKEIKKPVTFFTNIFINEVQVNLKKKYVLNYDKNSIKISFNTNGFQSIENINYLYKLKGYNDKWLKLEPKTNFIRFSSLPPGEFIFELKSRKGNVFSNTNEIKINISEPFWKKWWFYLIVSISVFALTFFYFKRNVRRLEREKKIDLEKAEMDKELIFSQLENLRSQMNPHFIFNALNSIQEYILSNEKQSASTYLVKFSRLIRLYLEHSRESEVPLSEEIKALNLYLELEKDRFENTLEYQITIDNKINIHSVFIPSLFIQPYVENAIKHGLLHIKKDRKLSLTFKLSNNNELICSIIDNGVGRKSSSEINKINKPTHKSFATTANQKRIGLINKTRIKKLSVQIVDLYDEQYKAIGTKVEIIIPL